MGELTELYVNVDLKPDTPDGVVATLRAMCGGDDTDSLAGKPRQWANLFRSGYAKFTLDDDVGEVWSLHAQGAIKNYANEIGEFFAWLMPWIDGEPGEFIGFTREEERMPKLVLLANADAIDPYGREAAVPTDAAVAAIRFALEADEGLAFLRAWLHGDFPEIRRDWPDAPEAVFVGADVAGLNPRGINAFGYTGAQMAVLERVAKSSTGTIKMDGTTESISTKG